MSKSTLNTQLKKIANTIIPLSHAKFIQNFGSKFAASFTRQVRFAFLFFLFLAGVSLPLARTPLLATPSIIDSIPHPETRFTQGLFWQNNELWESTGLVGHSKIYRMDKNGKTLDSISMRGRHFGEGIAKIGNRILWLTWQSRLGFILESEPLRAVGEFPLISEGWGLTVWQGSWLMSNGGSSLFALSLGDMQVIKKIDVKADGVPVPYLNELEAVGDTVYANVWQSDSIAVIHMPSGNVVKWLDFSNLVKAHRKANKNAEILNGIAFDGKFLWITGKNWRWIYKVK